MINDSLKTSLNRDEVKHQSFARYQLRKQINISYFAAVTFHGMIRPNWSEFYGPNFLKQSQFDKILLSFSVFFVMLSTSELMLNWISSLDIF